MIYSGAVHFDRLLAFAVRQRERRLSHPDIALCGFESWASGALDGRHVAPWSHTERAGAPVSQLHCKRRDQDNLDHTLFSDGWIAACDAIRTLSCSWSRWNGMNSPLPDYRDRTMVWKLDPAVHTPGNNLDYSSAKTALRTHFLYCFPLF